MISISLARRLGLTLLLTCCSISGAAELPRLDITGEGNVRDWSCSADVSAITVTPDGLAIQSTGIDPYITGPERDYPAGQLLWLKVRVRCQREGAIQVFYFKTHATEEASVRVPLSSGAWEDLRIPLPALGPGHRLRIDPPGGAGETVIAGLSFEPRKLLAQPNWPAPTPPRIDAESPRVRSGVVEVAQATEQFDASVITVDGRPMSAAFSRPTVGYVHNDTQSWIDLARAEVKVTHALGEILVSAAVRDEHGATWALSRRFSPAEGSDAVDVVVQVTVDRDRFITFLPMLVLTPGAGSFGESKQQAVFSGLEYLDKDEPSSSEADLEGPQSNRRVPDSLKITMPLMAIAHDDRYVGLIWERNDHVAALFDSPDRTFKSGGHVFGLILPGSNGSNREEGNLLPHYPQLVKANEPIMLKATIIGGRGASILPAIQQYVALRNLPEHIPTPPISDYLRTAASGWLDSAIRDGDRYRHAFPGNFAPHPAADAAVMMHWLGARTGDEHLKARLKDAARRAISQVPSSQYNASGVSHVRYPVASLLFGHTLDNALAARQQGLALLKRFEPDGRVLYKPGGVDYARTHFAKDANGLSANLVERLLECAAVSGDETLITEGLRLLRALDKFKNTVPRGAQTWEIPLHTPDILASAHLVRAYTLGYELTGDAHFLEMARHWAWTGVPFLYLENPVERPAGQYATIAVLGATSWVAPNWIGLPVQWCGLVYADALYRLAPHDPQSHWKQIADGITISGILQSWPDDSSDAQRRGLLPDSFALRQGIRNDAAINPGTVQANAAHLYGQPLYGFQSLRASGLLLHAPGRIVDVDEQPDRVSFRVLPWGSGEYSLLLSRCRTRPDVRINRKPAPDGAMEYDTAQDLLVLNVSGDVIIEITPR